MLVRAVCLFTNEYQIVELGIMLEYTDTPKRIKASLVPKVSIGFRRDKRAL